jgi:hypothetical protein
VVELTGGVATGGVETEEETGTVGDGVVGVGGIVPGGDGATGCEEEHPERVKVNKIDTMNKAIRINRPAWPIFMIFSSLYFKLSV